MLILECDNSITLTFAKDAFRFMVSLAKQEYCKQCEKLIFYMLKPYFQTHFSVSQKQKRVIIAFSLKKMGLNLEYFCFT